MIRLCLLVDSLGPDAGTERQVEETVRQIDRTQFEVHVCCFEHTPRLAGLAKHAKTAVFPLESVYSVQGVRQLGRFRDYLKFHRIDIVHTFMVKTAVFGVAAAGILGGAPVVITSRLNTGYWYTPFYLKLFPILNRFTTRIMANSIGAKKIAISAERVPPEKVDVVYQGVDMDLYSRERGDPMAAAELGIPESAKVVGIVANLRPVKDHALFLDAAQRVAAAIPEAVFLLVGQGDLKPELERRAVELGIRGRLYFSKPGHPVVDYLARFDVACLTSKSEGFSNAILEYMAAGLPVVATDVGGNAEAIEEGVTGFLVAERTGDALAAPMVRLLRDETLRREMGQRSWERCRDRFEMNHCIREFERYYRSLAPKR